MESDRLGLWINKLVPGGATLVLLHEQALGQGLTVCSWSRTEVDAAAQTGVDIAADVLLTAQEHADNLGEACRFQIQWQNDQGKSLRAQIHRCSPKHGTQNVYAENADAVSGNATQAQLLSHIAAQQRTMNGGISVVAQSFSLVMAAYDRAMTMQQKLLESQAVRLDSAPLAANDSGSEQVNALKAHALAKLIEIGPEIASMAIHAAKYAMKLDDNDNGGASDQAQHPPTNGAAASA